MIASPILDALIGALPSLSGHHSHASSVYPLLKQTARREIEALFAGGEPRPAAFGSFGEIMFPYRSMGAVDSLNLFDLDELILFAFYAASRGRYRRVADIGANLGLHSIVLSRCGYEVRAYEPDPRHCEILRENLRINGCGAVEVHEAAVSASGGTMEFVRVLGNTTGSHLAGSKRDPYGDLDRFPVAVEAVRPIMQWADLVKIDAEGHEKEMLLAVRPEDWNGTDALVEVENETNAAVLYDHFVNAGVNLFSQKTNWQRVRRAEDVPAGYREGTLFVTAEDEMLWQ